MPTSVVTHSVLLVLILLYFSGSFAQVNGSRYKGPGKCGGNLGKCNNNGRPTGKQSSTPSPPNDGGDAVSVTAMVVSGVVVVLIAILVTICYWIRLKHRRNGPNAKSLTVTYTADNKNVTMNDEASVATQPLPPIPGENYYITSTSQQNTYEQIDSEYTRLQRDIDVQREQAGDVNELTTASIEAESKGDAIELRWRETDSNEDSYTKLNHLVRNSIPDDVTNDYNKLIPTPVIDEESEEYSHLNRTALNRDESVTDPGYGKLELPVGRATGKMQPIAKSNDGYEETLPTFTGR